MEVREDEEIGRKKRVIVRRRVFEPTTGRVAAEKHTESLKPFVGDDEKVVKPVEPKETRPSVEEVKAAETKAFEEAVKPKPPIAKDYSWIEKESKAWYFFHRVIQNEDIYRVLLYGPKGTGKTTQASKTGENGFITIPMNDETTVAQVLGMWIPKGDSFEWFHGNGIRAWIEEKTLVLNEVDKASSGVMSLLHDLLDDKEIAAITLPTGDTVKPGKKFKCIATMNGGLSDLDDALLDRFDVKIEIREPHPEAVRRLEPDLQHLVRAAYSNNTLNITFREIVAFGKLRKTIGDEAYAVFGLLANDVRNVMKIAKK